MTPAMERVLAVLRDHAERDVQPTLGEIGDVLGVTKVAIHHTVSELERRGYLVRDHGRQRGIHLCAPPLGHVVDAALVAELESRGFSIQPPAIALPLEATA